MDFETEISQSIAYLESDEGRRAVDTDTYWPKWHSPWWHMLLLHEMGHAELIPQAIVDLYVERLDRTPLKIFPIHPEDMPPGVDPFRGSPCHCQLGNVYQVLAARGVDVDAKLPWIRPWFLRYQMADGGLSCDNDAYLVQGECPSSMVGTIATLEAVLLHTHRPWTAQERAFLDKGWHFLVDREVRLGSASKHNASERNSAESWTKLCFPRFYFYDVLRGLSVLLSLTDKLQRQLSVEAIQVVVDRLTSDFPTGTVSPGRRSIEGTTTLKQDSSGNWIRRQAATTFPLLDAVSVVGRENAFLSKQWEEAKRRLSK